MHGALSYVGVQGTPLPAGQEADAADNVIIRRAAGCCCW